MTARGDAPGNKRAIIEPHRGEVKHITVISKLINDALTGLIPGSLTGYLGRCPKLYYGTPMALLAIPKSEIE